MENQVNQNKSMCPKCGAILAPNVSFCTSCGTPVPNRLHHNHNNLTVNLVSAQNVEHKYLQVSLSAQSVAIKYHKVLHLHLICREHKMFKDLLSNQWEANNKQDLISVHVVEQ